MKNNLFNQSLMKKYSKDKIFKLTVLKYDFLKKHVEKIENGDFKSEVSSYLYFYDFLKDILGYDREKNILFDEKEDKGRGKSEFALKTGDKKFMVIELKDQNTDLDKPQTRVNDKRTPVDQAFDYAQHSGDVDWIFVSNFKEFRLYNWGKKSDKYICFDYDDLLNKKIFQDFMLTFSGDSHIKKGYPEKLLEETLIVEKQLESNFYKLFHETRLMIIRELEELNEFNRDDAVHYAQLILNRYMFISFAEDSGLLPGQISTDTIATPIKKGNIRRNSVWQRLNELFLDINEGNDFKGISAYNGGLFEEDLGFIKIRDIVDDQDLFKDIWQEWKFEEYEESIKDLLEPYTNRVNPIYKNFLIISSFDFSSELDVNILGHIFENSIGDLEELKEDTKGRRKKEGIFYTPEYITDYICRNTIIPYLSKSGKAENIADLLEEYSWSRDIEDLDQKVKEIKIVDPACGSGAFLNKATDILLDIHEAIFDFKKGYTKTTDMRVGKGKRRRIESIQHTDLGAYVFDHIEKRREILLNNIFGVDLNEESVEITKLSLFLKVCRKNLKLPNLDKNIKNGNSIIDDPEYTDKPFNWEQEFSEIFKEGGFDVVIGNPPYVRQEKIKEIKPYLKEHYEVYTGVADLYVYFFEKGLKILKQNGLFSFICSDKFIKANYGKPLRNFILKHGFLKYNEYKGKGVFQDATVDPFVIVMSKDKPDDLKEVTVNNDFQVPYDRLYDNIWNFVSPQIMDLKEKMENKGTKIKDLRHINIHYGIKTGFNKAFIIDKKTKDNLIGEDYKNKEIIKPLIRGRDIQRWEINFKDYYLLFIDWEFNIDDYPSIKNYLLNFKENLDKRSVVKKGSVKWFALSSYGSTYFKKFENPKLIYPVIKTSLFSVYDNAGYYINDKCFMITSNDMNLKYLCSLLSSKPLDFLFKLISNPIARTSTNLDEKPRYELRKIYVEQLPIYPATQEQQLPFIEKAELMLKLNRQLREEINGFKHWIEKEFNVDKLSRKLEKYYMLSEDEFIDELRKKKVDTKSRKNREYLEREFTESLAIIKPLLQKIEETDKEIDQMVYELYGLTHDEIQIIENILK